MKRACVIGSGPNGLAAAIVLAQEGLQVDVFEAQDEPGGGARTLPLTLPGFLHDFGSAIHPMAVGSPFFRSLPLADYGLHWIHGEVPLVHPLDDATAVVLERSLDDTEKTLDADGRAWRRLMQPLVDHWDGFAEDGLGPAVRMPHHPFLMAHFALKGIQPAQRLARSRFAGVRARALFAGLAAHSFLSFDQPLSSAFGIVLGATAHVVGWPVPRSGSQAIAQTLIAHLESLGGKVHTSRRIDTAGFRALYDEHTLMMCDTTPRQLLQLAGGRIRRSTRQAMSRFEHGPGAFKIDYALSEPVPWRAKECFRSIGLHLGGTFEEIAAAESEVSRGKNPERPFVLVAQPSLFDSTRAPAGKHVLWAYCHVPNGSPMDMTARIEAQIERFAPGFRDCILARHVLSPSRLEKMDENLVGGDISGGAFTVKQFLARPSLRTYGTGVPNLFLCSASTPPGGGVHGMCGYHAAKLALRRFSSP
ncbi:MAG TPA: NAD(P)/FAD-dependent oxidoreductase [Terracidiphilus sp.]|nr:NAD(P)/FAD-dependent oxidoreductase [Terracidiphilus sp.]